MKGPISYRFRDERRFRSKIVKISHPIYFAPPLTGFPLDLCIGALSCISGLPLELPVVCVKAAKSASSTYWETYQTSPGW